MLLNERYPEDNPVKRLCQNRKDLKNVELAIEQIRNSSIVDECYRTAKEYCDSACGQIQDLPVDSSRQAL
jgi:geranylgeranyl pyrophosphate synthase